ncbi:hypothetical protein CTAM01_02756 [Colletotrichum tamarilloi]|uniref:Uncharacterized protein n=1 Tax=Colletotrichum tamarilloi TaxID=1209934 RepID=A0ABQ9RMX6_9PEZI|nr:uncharacterized protein CTAM01_02756 [Colletotrichum tamarilloi]KAK1507644.1 hypothetical protein CTAM01_02756 [Colletotrichum tamarilloi]
MKARNTSRSGEVENLLLGLVYLFTIVTLSAVFNVEPDNEVSTSSSSARQHEAQDDEASASDSDSDYANNLDLIQVNLKRSPARSATDSADLSTTIDLALAGQRFESRAHPTRALSVPGFDSDHRPLHTRISFAPNRDKELRFNWDRANEKKYCKEAKSNCSRSAAPLSELQLRLMIAPKRLCWPSTKLFAGPFPATGRSLRGRSPKWSRKTSNALTDDEILHCFKDEIWPKTSGASEPPAPEIPKLDPKRPQLITPQCMSDEELHEAFASVERGKAAGPDDIISNALKVGWAEIYKYFKHLVNASFMIFYHPLFFATRQRMSFPSLTRRTMLNQKRIVP